ncbi:hypothetical protein AABB24_006902 [Solanum stoloniferum]|uniref:Uncharacterized protein n=1 Tax=Solanum stoloniferum TaxID=62892 RepID=A0ABD2V7F3_9SOLN
MASKLEVGNKYHPRLQNMGVHNKGFAIQKENPLELAIIPSPSSHRFPTHSKVRKYIRTPLIIQETFSMAPNTPVFKSSLFHVNIKRKILQLTHKRKLRRQLSANSKYTYIAHKRNSMAVNCKSKEAIGQL